MRRYIYSAYEDIMMDRLNKLNQEGYVLEKTGKFFKFIRNDLKVKYNIRYEELEDIQGYHYVGEYKRAHFYYTTDLSSPDLPSDADVKAQALLNNYHLGFAVLSAFIALFCLPLAITTISSTINDFSKYYLDFPNFVMALMLLVVNIYTSMALYATIKHRDAITKQQHFSVYFKSLDVFMLILEGLIYIIGLIGTIQKFSLFWFILFHIWVLHFIFSDIANKKLVNNKYFSALLWIFLTSFYAMRTGMYIYENVTDFPSTEQAYIYNQNYYMTKIYADEYKEEDTAMGTIYYECRTDKAAKAALKEILEPFENNKIPNDMVDEFYEIIRNDGLTQSPIVNYAFKKGELVVRFAELDPENVENRITEYIEYFNKK